MILVRKSTLGARWSKLSFCGTQQLSGIDWAPAAFAPHKLATMAMDARKTKKTTEEEDDDDDDVKIADETEAQRALPHVQCEICRHQNMF